VTEQEIWWLLSQWAQEHHLECLESCNDFIGGSGRPKSRPVSMDDWSDVAKLAHLVMTTIRKHDLPAYAVLMAYAVVPNVKPMNVVEVFKSVHNIADVHRARKRGVLAMQVALSVLDQASHYRSSGA